MANPFVGQRSTADFVTNEAPQNYRAGILALNPDGNSPLIALTSMGKKEATDSTHVHWWTRTLHNPGGAVAGIYINASLATAYVYATHQATYGVKGAVVYAKVAEALTRHFVVNHQVLLRDTDRPTADVVGRVVGVEKNGSSSFVAIKLLENDDNHSSPSTYNLSTVDYIYRLGSVNAQGGAMTDSISYDPVQITNVTQIFRTPLDLTRTAMRESVRTVDKYVDAKALALFDHGRDMETALIFGIKDESSVGDNGKPMFAHMGLREFIKTYSPNNIDDFRYNTDFTGTTWDEAGLDWLDVIMGNIFKYTPSEPGSFGDMDRLALCDMQTVIAINRAIKKNPNTNYMIENAMTEFGIKVMKLHSVAGSLSFKVHPLFAHDSSMTGSMLVVDPNYLICRPLDDTEFYEDERKYKRTGGGIDGIKEEWLTELTWEFHYPELFGYYTGIGYNNVA